MNPDARILFSDGERAARDGAWPTARACFIEAGDAAVDVQLWKSGLRCYRHALEIDLFDRDVLTRIARFPPRVLSGRGWGDYGSWIERVAWPHFGCRPARIVSGDLGAVVECVGIGPVLELIMSDHDLVEVRPDGRFQGLPSAMALIDLPEDDVGDRRCDRLPYESDGGDLHGAALREVDLLVRAAM